MKFTRLFVPYSILIFVIHLSACKTKKNGACFETKEDSVAFVKSMISTYPELNKISNIGNYTGLNIRATTSGEVPVSTLSDYVRDYKEYVNNPAQSPVPPSTYTKQYSYTLQKKDLEELLKIGGCEGIRVYMGVPDNTAPEIHTVILTGYNSDGGDLYIMRGTTEYAIDQASPCPNDCPYRYSEGVDATGQPIANKRLLGRIQGKDPQ